MSEPFQPREFRGSERSALSGPVRLRFGSEEELAGEATDISLGGIFVASSRPQPVGTILRFAIDLPAAEAPISGFGEVVWIRVRDEARDRPAGMGIQFRYLDGEGEEQLKEHLVRHQAELLRLAAELPPLAAEPADLGDLDATVRAPAGLGAAPAWPVPPAGDRPFAVADPFLDLPSPAAPQLASGFAPAAAPEPPRAAPSSPATLSSAAAPATSVPSFGLRQPPASPDDTATARRQAPAKGRRLWVYGGLAALLAVVAGLGWAFLGRGEAPRASARPRKPVASRPTAAPLATPPATTPTTPEEASGEEPSAPAAVAESTGAAPAASAPQLPPAGQLLGIRWSTADGRTVVVLETDGDLAASRITTEALGDVQPRQVLKISGLDARAVAASQTVASAELRRIRVGDHPDLGQIFVVFDLADSRVDLLGVVSDGKTVEATLGRR